MTDLARMTGRFQSWQTEPLGAIILAWLGRRWRTPSVPDPWPEEIESALWGPDALEVCHHCFTPHDEHGWFCPECGASVGPYNNWMDYLQIFAIGEVMRSGVGTDARFTRLTVPGYIVLGLLQFGLFSPVYFFRLVMNWRRVSREAARPTTSLAEETGGADSADSEGVPRNPDDKP